MKKLKERIFYVIIQSIPIFCKDQSIHKRVCSAPHLGVPRILAALFHRIKLYICDLSIFGQSEIRPLASDSEATSKCDMICAGAVGSI